MASSGASSFTSSTGASSFTSSTGASSFGGGVEPDATLSPPAHEFNTSSTETPDACALASADLCTRSTGAFNYPIAGDSDGFVYEHESTTLSNSPNLNSDAPFCTSGPIELGNGDNYVQCNQIIPDEEANTLPGVTISFKGKFTPLGSETDFGSFTFENDGYTDARFTARQVQMTITGSTNQDFQVGNIRLNVRTRGRR